MIEKIDFSKFSHSDKETHLTKIITLEKEFDINKDNPLAPYSRQDITELLQNLRDYLRESDANHTILHQISPIITKYITNDFGSKTDNYSEENSHGEHTVMIHDEPIKAHAAACQILLTFHVPSIENLNICVTLDNDVNSYVRYFVIYDFLIHMKTSLRTMHLAIRKIDDNKLARFFLWPFMQYLKYGKDNKSALQFYKEIIQFVWK